MTFTHLTLTWENLRGPIVVSDISTIHRQIKPDPSVERSRLAIATLFALDRNAEQLEEGVKQRQDQYDDTCREAVHGYHMLYHPLIEYIVAAQSPELASEIAVGELKLGESRASSADDRRQVPDVMTRGRIIRGYLIHDQTGFSLVDASYRASVNWWIRTQGPLRTPLPPFLYGADRAVENYKAVYELARKQLEP